MKTLANCILGIAALFVAATLPAAEKTANGSMVEHLDAIGRAQPAPHDGPGETTGHPFFESADDLAFAFRVRRLPPGSGIGYHLHSKDEVYYVMEGRGVLTLNEEKSTVGPGNAILTRPGDSHGLMNESDEDLVILIVFERGN